MNENQAKAVSAREPMVLVSAGAGSGKTRVLTHRYVELLEKHGIRIDQMLTLTFTRKAALEMRGRIARLLEEKKLVHERRELTRAPIGTIHSFCERLLREHALAAGIDPNFRLLDEAEARTLQENALDATFSGVWTELRRQNEELGRLLVEFPYTILREELLAIYSKARAQGIDVTTIHPAAGAEIAPAAGDLCRAVEGLLSLDGTKTWQQARVNVADAYAELQLIIEDARQGFTWEHYYRVQELLPALTPSAGPRGTAKAARDEIKAAMACWIGACLEPIAAGFLRAFLTLLHLFEQNYRRAKDDQGLLDFNDLLLVTGSLLDPVDGSGAPEYFRRRFRQVMVDEFQDTNTLQFRIIKALQGDGDLFMVGDVKQAIYRFIGSDVGVFLTQEADIATAGDGGQRIAMTENYRSRGEILGVLNGLFTRLWTEESRAERGGFCFEALTTGREFAATAQPAVELACWPEEHGNMATLRDREAGWIARRILQLTGRLGAPALDITEQGGGDGQPLTTRPADYADVVLLFRASGDIPRYEDALRQAGVPFYVVSGRGFYQAREVQDLVHMLRALDNPLDDFALAVVLRSPLVGISDETLYWLARDWSSWKEGEASYVPTDDGAGAQPLPPAPSPRGKGEQAGRAYEDGWNSPQNVPPLPSRGGGWGERLSAGTDTQGGRLWKNILRVVAVGQVGQVGEVGEGGAGGLPPIGEDQRKALAAFYQTVLLLQGEMPAGQPLDLIDLILARTGYTARLLAAEGGEQRFANVQKLREVAATFQARGIFDLSDFQRYLTQLEKIAPREASAPLDVEASQVVRLMTIHAAKGLEAPIVLLADCGREQPRSTARFLLSPAGLTCTLPTPESEWAPTAGHEAAQRQLAADDLHEAERLLYVALTRAAEHLICCGSANFSAKHKRTSYADLLLSLLALDAPPEADVDLLVSDNDIEYPVRVWSPASLAALEAVPVPPQPPTLWEEHREAILAGKPLPVLAADEVEYFARIVARLRQLPQQRRTGPLRVGVNRAICYAKCPRQYWFRYLLRSEPPSGAVLPPRVEKSDIPQSDTLHGLEAACHFADGTLHGLETPGHEDDERARMDGTLFGQLLHGVLQRVEFNGDLLAQLDAIYPNVAAEVGAPAGEAERLRLGACLQRLLHLPIYADLLLATRVERELRFLAQEGGVFVPGIIDLLACTDDHWWILDYKTGHASADHLRQVAIYALGVQHALGVTPARVCVAYLDGDSPHLLRDEPITPALFDDARRIIRQAGEGILREDYHPQPGRHCEFCPFIATCPDGVAAVAPVA